MSVFTTANGARKEITRLLSGNAGTVRELKGAYSGDNGSVRRIFGLHRWEKWSSVKNVTYEDYREPNFGHLGELVWTSSAPEGDYSYSFNTDSGKYFVRARYKLTGGNLTEPAYPATVSSGSSRLWEITQYGENYEDGDTVYIPCYGYVRRANEKVTYSKGNISYGYVESSNPKMYPDNGIADDGFWYVKVEVKND